MAFCSNCGDQLPEGAAACPRCGTPSQLPAEVPVAPVAGVAPYADFGERFLGWLIDVVVLAIAEGVLGRRGGGTVVWFLYNWLMLALNDGRTLGKMAMNIRVARPDGSAIDMGTAAIRSAMALVSGIALAIGYLWAAWDPEKRTWHDIVANTRVFKNPR